MTARIAVDKIMTRLAKAPVALSDDHYLLEPLAANISLGRLVSGDVAAIVVLDGRARAGSLEFGGLKLEAKDNAEIHVGSKVKDAALSVVACTDASLHHNFAILVADMVDSVSRSPTALRTAAQVRQFVNEWADLFARRRSLSDAEEIGLWGELEVLAMLPDVERGVAVWHGPAAGTFDFGGNNQLIEVKTSVRKHEHYFSLEQLTPPTTKSHLVVASVRLVDDPASGSSVDDQVARVRGRLSASLDFDRKLARLGYRRGANLRAFSLKEAWFFRGADVPTVRRIDPGVTEVSFLANLSGKAPVAAKTVSTVLARLVA